MASIIAQVAAATHFIWADKFHQDGQPGLIIASKFGTTLALGQDGVWVDYTPKHFGWDVPSYPCSGCTLFGLPNGEYDPLSYYTDTDPWGRKCKVLYEPIDHPDGGVREVREYPGGRTYSTGYRAGGTWVDGWWD